MIDSLNDLSNYDKENNSESTFNSSSDGIPRSSADPNSLTKESNQEQINFINFTQQYCIGFIDIINSTQETAKIKDPKKLRKYYSLFLNSMSTILTQYHGKIIKNSGDNLFFYFEKRFASACGEILRRSGCCCSEAASPAEKPCLSKNERNESTEAAPI